MPLTVSSKEMTWSAFHLSNTHESVWWLDLRRLDRLQEEDKVWGPRPVGDKRDGQGGVVQNLGALAIVYSK